MADKFTLTINLGNEAMQTPQDIAEALREVVRRLDLHSLQGTEPITGKIRDLNGNTVGEWKIE